MNRLRDFWASRIGPRDRRPTHEWAADNISLVPPLTKTGPFDVSGSRHFIDPLNALDDPRVREFNEMAPVRSGKTLKVDVWSMSIVARTPGPLLWLFQEENAAQDQAELRTWGIIRANQNISDLLPADRHKKRTTEIIFPSMPFHIKGPAISNLSSRGYQYVILDEPWQYKAGRMEEARGRLGDYVRMGTDKFVCISQGGTDGDDWDRQFRRGVIHEWTIQCMGCGLYMLPRWSGQREDGTRWGMIWDTHKEPSGLWDVPKCVPSVRYECQYCGHPHIDGTRTKSEWNRTGKYDVEKTDKNPKRKSFHYTAVIDYPWDELVDLYLQAINSWKMGVSEPLIQFFQKRMAEPKSERLLLEEGTNFRTQKYEINSDWEDESERVLTADRQAEDVYWVMVRGWAKTGESRRLWFGKLFSGSEIEAKRSEYKVHPKRVLIDSGFKPKGDHGVYADCIRYSWIPVKGVGEESGMAVVFKHRVEREEGGDLTVEIVERSYAEPAWVDPEIGKGRIEDQVQLIRFSAPTYADRVDALIERGLWKEPELDDGDPMDAEYRRQMSAEFKKAKRDKFTGVVKMVRVCPSRNNHAYDCAKMQVLGATLLDILPDLDLTPESSRKP